MKAASFILSLFSLSILSIVLFLLFFYLRSSIERAILNIYRLNELRLRNLITLPLAWACHPPVVVVKLSRLNDPKRYPFGSLPLVGPTMPDGQPLAPETGGFLVGQSHPPYRNI